MDRLLKKFDIFSHVQVDLTTTTRIGGCVSILTVLALLLLTILEIQSLLSVTTQTRIQVSHREDEEFRVNVNLTFPAISCDWISIDLIDVLGHSRTNITSTSMHKHTLHGAYVASAIRKYGQKTPVVQNTSTDVEQYKDQHRVVELSPQTFDSVVQYHRVTLVNFYAPWCPYCVALHPIYEHAAEVIAKKIYPSREIALTTVNCVSSENFELCRNHHIQVFPTIRIFRDGNDNPQGDHHMHEEYRGSRTAEDISAVALRTLKEVLDGHPKAPNDESATGYTEYASYGCVVSGYVKVAKVPGTLLFTPHAEGHNFHVQNINLTHVFNYLSFGNAGQRKPKKYKKHHRQQTANIGAYSGEDSNGTLFISYDGRITHEHYTKVVQTVLESLNGDETETYEYTINSNLYESAVDAVPVVKITWDVWPMEVIKTETRRPLIEGLCQTIGFLGGVFASFMLLERMLYGTWQRIKKLQEGKQT